MTTRSLSAAALTLSLLAGGCVSQAHPHLARATNITLAAGAGLLIAGAMIGTYQDAQCTKAYELCLQKVPDSMPGAATLLIGSLMGLTLDVMKATEPPVPLPPPS